MIKSGNMMQLEPPNIRYEHVFVILQDGKTYIYKRNVCLLTVTPADEENNDEELQ